jgi:hypothetical protein
MKKFFFLFYFVILHASYASYENGLILNIHDSALNFLAKKIKSKPLIFRKPITINKQILFCRYKIKLDPFFMKIDFDDLKMSLVESSPGISINAYLEKIFFKTNVTFKNLDPLCLGFKVNVKGNLLKTNLSTRLKIFMENDNLNLGVSSHDTHVDIKNMDIKFENIMLARIFKPIIEYQLKYILSDDIPDYLNKNLFGNLFRGNFSNFSYNFKPSKIVASKDGLLLHFDTNIKYIGVPSFCNIPPLFELVIPDYAKNFYNNPDSDVQIGLSNGLINEALVASHLSGLICYFAETLPQEEIEKFFSLIDEDASVSYDIVLASPPVINFDNASNNITSEISDLYFRLYYSRADINKLDHVLKIKLKMSVKVDVDPEKNFLYIKFTRIWIDSIDYLLGESPVIDIDSLNQFVNTYVLYYLNRQINKIPISNSIIKNPDFEIKLTDFLIKDNVLNLFLKLKEHF